MVERGPHVLGIPTASGGKVSLPFLTAEQASEIKASFADVAPAFEAETWTGKTKPCTNCDGRGKYAEQRATKTASGGTVVTMVEVPCRPCKGEETVPDKG